MRDFRDFERAIIAERSLLGGILLDSSLIHDIEVTTDDFASEVNRQIFAAIQQLLASGSAIDIITVSDHLERETGNRWLHIVGEVAKECLSISNAPAYAQIVKEAAIARRALDVANRLAESEASQTDVDAAIRELMGLYRARRNYERHIVDSYSAALEKIDEIYQAGGGIVGVPSGLAEVDACLGGLQKSDLVVIGARPAMGKTALLLNMADRCGRACGIISAEQGHEQIGLRMIAIRGGISAHRMRLAKIEESEWALMAGLMLSAKDRKIWIYDRPAPTLDDVIRQARKWKHFNAIEVLFLDYIQRIKVPGADTRRDEVALVCMGLKELARELDIPVVALAQVKREVETRTDKRPLISDLKEAGEIEQEADQIILLYRDEVYNESSSSAGIAELSVSKNRHGPCGVIRVAWRGEFMRFDDLARKGDAWIR